MKNKFFKYSYPLLIVLIPILSQFTNNIFFIEYEDLFRPVFWVISILLIFIITLNIFIKHIHRSSLISATAVFLLLIYGHVYISLEKYPDLQRHRYIIAGFVFVFVFLSYIYVKKIYNYEEVGKTISTVALVLIVFSVFQIGKYQIDLWKTNTDVEQTTPVIQNNSQISIDENLPDIYWIVLDGYTRTDVLQSDYNYNNSIMINGLENLGFYVAKCSQSNYPNTVYSLTSALNINYLQDILDSLKTLPSWASSTVIRTLRNHGYQIISFKNSVRGHFDLKEDILIQRNGKAVPGLGLFGNLTEFELLLFNTSILRVFKDGEGLFQNDFSRNASFNEHYFQTMFNIENVQNLSEYKSPKFVMLHIIAPHDPYVFSPEGDYSSKYIGNQLEGYATNVQFLDNTIPDMIQNIIANSTTKPIIIIQGDHGPTGTSIPESRMRILNAFYFPNNQAFSDLYPEISPVNNFRVLLNNLVNENFTLLDDKAYYAYGKKITDNNILEDDCSYDH